MSLYCENVCNHDIMIASTPELFGNFMSYNNFSIKLLLRFRFDIVHKTIHSFIMDWNWGDKFNLFDDSHFPYLFLEKNQLYFNFVEIGHIFIFTIFFVNKCVMEEP